jgi:hypothetical protein
MPGRRLLIPCLALLLLASPAIAAPKAVLWERWLAHDPAATATIDHTPFARFLERYLLTFSDGVNRLAYAEVTAEDRRLLDGYVESLAATPISTFARPEQMAYWINLYNALTLQVVLDHYPTASIRDIDISPGLFSDGPWGKKLVAIEGERVALDDIEHQILRPIWRDPRIHYAVNCASIGCPNLRPEPYQPAELDRQLDQAAIDFINHPRGVSLDGDRLQVSSIYDWFQADFGGSEEGVLAHLKAFAEPELHDRDWQDPEVQDPRRDEGTAGAGRGQDSLNAPACHTPQHQNPP